MFICCSQYGAPGSGKTSIIHSLAGELGLDIYIVSLSRLGLDDTMLNSLITSLPERCIALMEDIDAAFRSGITRDMTTEDEPEKNDGSDPDGRKPDTESGMEKGPSATRITLSGLLNALDGVAAQEGRLLFATTNRYSALDPALTRPGRMDLHVEFRLASWSQARELYCRFFLPSAVQLDPHRTTNDEMHTADSGYSTPGKDVTVDDNASKPPSPRSSTTSLPVNETETPAFNGMKHSLRAPALSVEQVERLASQFADAIPVRQFSMASLQGYLMLYKVRPLQAVEDITQWVQGNMAEKGRGMKGSTQHVRGDKPEPERAVESQIETVEVASKQVPEDVADVSVTVEKKDAVVQTPNPGDGEEVVTS